MTLGLLGAVLGCLVALSAAEEQCGGGPVRCYQTVGYYVFMSLLKASHSAS